MKRLLEMLDLTFAMKSCPSRSKRLKLLKKTIGDVRMNMGQKTEPPSLEQNNTKEEEEAPLILPQEEEGTLLLNLFSTHCAVKMWESTFRSCFSTVYSGL